MEGCGSLTLCLFSLKLFNGCTSPSQMVLNKEMFWIKMENLPLACMNDVIGRQIKKSIGEVQECDVQTDGIFKNECYRVLRVKVEMDIKKLIPRGRTINLLGNKLWIPFTFEKLLRIFLKCGKIIHRP